MKETDNAVNFSHIAAILEHIICGDNGPYALITWTDQNCHTDLVNYIRDRLSEEKQPFALACLDKNVHLDNPAGLLQALKDMHTSIPQMAALLDWEKKVEGATVNTLHTLVSLAQEGNPPNTHPDKLDELLSVMAMQAVGANNVDGDKLAAVNGALAPILFDRLMHLQNDGPSTSLWSSAITKNASSPKLSAEKSAVLNAIMHIAPAAASLKNYERGIILKLPATWIDLTTFNVKWGVSQEDAMIKSYGLNAGLAAPSWVLIQIQASCDYANPKPGPIPFVLGLMIPSTTTIKAKSSRPEALWISPMFKEGADIFICSR